ncbi:MAG TPA: ATP-binding protein, partial [Acidimicrobiales bacterium]
MARRPRCPGGDATSREVTSRVARVSSGGRSRTRGVGRASELATAAFARDAARAGRGSVLAVTGDAGSGKTWLCESIAESAADEGFRVGWGAGWPGEGVPELWPWQQAVGPLGDLTTKALLAAPPAVDDPDWFTRCVAVVDHLRQVAGERPTVLVLDDVHLADRPSRLLTQFVARHVRGLPLVLVVAHRPADDLAGLQRDATPLTLHGLGPADAAALLAARGVDALAADDLSFLVDATGGLPGNLHRLANTAVDAAGVVRAVVHARLADLPPDVRRVA